MLEWSRVEPDEELLNLAAQGLLALLYPGDGSDELSDLMSSLAAKEDCDADVQGVVVLDGTWQEARKIFNKSPYSHNLPRIALQVNRAPRYNLRRNQLEQGLCTAECVAHLLQALGQESEAERLNNKLVSFIEGFTNRQ